MTSVNVDQFRNQKIVILGMARQGTALARFFAAAGSRVTVSDSAAPEKLTRSMQALAHTQVELVLGAHPESLLENCALLCVSGGVAPQIPIVQEAIRRGIPLSNDSLLTMQLAPCPVIAITGSSGKTTTTTLVGEMLALSSADTDRMVHVGGNIGQPLLDRLDQIRTQDLIVMELSSFQLELFDPAVAWGSFQALGPSIGAILNITPNHLDRHGQMRAYAGAKLNLLRHLQPTSQVVLNADDAVTARLQTGQPAVEPPRLPREWQLEPLLAESRAALAHLKTATLPFSIHQPLPCGAGLEDDQLCLDGRPICRRQEIRLRGDHNISNLLAAAVISGSAGAQVEAIATVARTFQGVPHRLEVVSAARGVTWINDSIATTPERAVAGLRCFEPGHQTLVLLAGGKDKGLPWTTLADEVLARVNYLIGFGQAGPLIVEAVQDRARQKRSNAPSCAVVGRLDEAVELAARIVTTNSVVLLAPGGTSFDAYENYEVRGKHFRELITAVVINM